VTAADRVRQPDWAAMSPRHGHRTLFAFGALVLVAGACSDGDGVDSLERLENGTDPGDGSLDSPETLAMIGDSITFMSTEALQAELSDTGLEVLAIDAQVGRRITVGDSGQPYPGTEIVDFIANSDPPDVWVIALGTNDIGKYADGAEFAAQVQALLDLLPAAAPLVWVDTWYGAQVDQTQLVNDTLRSVVGERDNAIVADWASHADDEGVVTFDLVHPTTDGIAVFAQVVADGVDSLLATL
jgi:lysophospholipase L1-like esterase